MAKSETLSETRQKFEARVLETSKYSKREDFVIGANGYNNPILQEWFGWYRSGMAAGRLQGLEEAQCDKQFHMYVWTKEPFFYAVAQARSVHEARTLMLEEVGSGDGSCPEREEAAKWIKEQQPFIFHRENATFALTDSAEQVEMSAYIEKLQQKLAKRAECKCWCGKECGCPCHDGTIREKANG